MCGIVCYFGSAGNSLTRLLTAMSAIIYRAPDATGIGMFGDDQEPIRLRKSLGAVSQLAETLPDAAAYPNQSRKLLNLWHPETDEVRLEQSRKRLLAFEEHSPSHYEPFFTGEKHYLSFRELLKSSPAAPMLRPGTPGSVASMPVIAVGAPTALKRAIHRLSTEYDLSTVVIRSLLRRALRETGSHSGGRPITAEVLHAFDQIFEAVAANQPDYPARPSSQTPDGLSPELAETVWACLASLNFQPPMDFDTDGVRAVFRLLDGALMSRLKLIPALHVELQKILETLWPTARERPNTDWQTLYWAEKGVNVYGWGAAAVLTYLQRMEVMPRLLSASRRNGDSRVRAFLDGVPDPQSLRFLSQPIIAHGRWALQSAVTLRNTHPFFDRRQERCVILNGQFSSRVETELKDYLETVVGAEFRTGNSTEYLSLLWGHCFDNLAGEQKHYEEIMRQQESGLDAYHVGSHAIDYRVYRKVRGKSREALDEMAFIEAVRRMAADGGQLAAAGISLHSPRRLYVASHNRPAFVVQRTDDEDIMVVSDINAALGLFSQSLIRERVNALRRLEEDFRESRTSADPAGSARDIPEETDHLARYARERNRLLKPFRVTVLPLEGRNIFVRLETGVNNGRLRRFAAVTNFDGNPLPDIEAFSTVLNPLQIRKELYGSFYESHLNEIPARFRDILDFYLPGEDPTPRFDLKERHLTRRFGKKWRSLKRIILAGMGSSRHMGLMAEPIFNALLPGLDVRVISPAELDDPGRAFFPENDLVLLLSWSATTADMVEFAKDLIRKGITAIGVTEKVFGDMSLVAAKSGGVLPVRSGEEVTVSGLKSTLCMLLCLHLFAVWLACRRNRRNAAHDHAEALRALPETLASVLNNTALQRFAATLAEANAASHACLIIGDLSANATPYEVALKVEENSWRSIAKSMDFGDVTPELIQNDPGGHALIVNATQPTGIDDALRVMEAFHRHGVPFALLTAEGLPRQEEMAAYSDNNCFRLPAAAPTLQPFIDCLFYYRFAAEYARARGRKPDDFPRNRAKSVTAGRSRPVRTPSPTHALKALEPINTAMHRQTPKAGDPADGAGTETHWETSGATPESRQFYREIRELSALLGTDTALTTLLEFNKKMLPPLGRRIFGDLTEGGEIVFLPLDREAEAAARHAACQWPRFTGCPMWVARPGADPAHFHEDALVWFLAARPPETEWFRRRLSGLKHPAVWIGPALEKGDDALFRTAAGYFELASNHPRSSATLYAALSLLLTGLWQTRSPKKAAVIRNHLRHAGAFVRTVLNDAELLKNITALMSENRDYATAFYVGPLTGTGLDWSRQFGRRGGIDFAWHLFGESAHGPLATVDDRVSDKFIALERQQALIARYGAERVGEWERRFLSGVDVDAFLEAPPNGGSRSRRDCPPPGPFFTGGTWYLPVLRPDYDTMDDNLIFMDTTRSHFFGMALDEMATFGCRHARLAVITQQAFCAERDKRALFAHPVSHQIILPSPMIDETRVPVSGFLIPFIMQLAGTALADAIVT